MSMILEHYPNNRVLPFEGVLNFRDMGGYESMDGRKVKYGLFFRSAELTGMTAKDVELFTSLGIKTILIIEQIRKQSRSPIPCFQAYPICGLRCWNKRFL